VWVWVILKLMGRLERQLSLWSSRSASVHFGFAAGLILFFVARLARAIKPNIHREKP
jgi:hypothetical protein